MPKNETKSLKADSLLGHYEIIKQIGAGGMGEVYLAEDKKLDRKVAIKILNEKFSRDEPNLRRFIQEAKAVSVLNHPNILVIHEIGEAGDVHFIVSEFVEGKTLREILKQSSLKLSEVLDFSIQIAGALSAAHTAHIIHRDIKPENVMVRTDGYVKILDFGLAKLVPEQKSLIGLEDETAEQNQTAKGVILGTVNYMSPEQAKGEKVDGRTDIFSFGVLLYEMIAGRIPFVGDSVSETLANLINKEPQPLSRFAANVPDELQRIVSKMLRKSKDERYQTMKGLLADLKDLRENLAFDERLEKSHPPDAENATKILQTATGGANLQTAAAQNSFSQKISRHKSAALTALATFVIALAVVGYFAFFAPQSPITSVAVLPFINENGNADIEYLSDGMTETLISSLSQLPNLNVKARSTVFRYKGRETNPQTIGKELNVQAILNGRVVQRGEQLILSLELVDAQTENVIWSESYNRKTADLIALQSEIARDVSGKLRLKLSGAEQARLAKNYTANPEAYQLYLKGRFYLNKRTKPDMQKALDYFQQSVAVDPNYALGYAGLVENYLVIESYRIAPLSETKPKAKDAVLKALSLDPELGEAHTALGFLLFQDGDDEGAEREFQRAVELNPNYAMTYHYYSNLLRSQKKYEEALAMQRRALEIEPLSLIINREYAMTHFIMRRYDEAIAQFKKTVELDAGFPSVHYNFSLPYWMKGNYPEAVEEQAKYQELNGEPSKAALLRESFAKGGWQGFLRTITDESRQIDLSWDNLTAYYAALGEKDKAFELLTKRFENRKIRPAALDDPRLDPLRDDPRFQDLLRRVGLPQ